MTNETRRPEIDQVVLMTGASSGIGAALAMEYARHGARLALLARRKDRLMQLREECLTIGASSALAIECDVTKDGDLDRAVNEVVRAFGRIDTVFANAGFPVTGRLDELKISDYQRQFETNVFGVLRTIFATIYYLKESHGRLVITGSVAGRVPLLNGSAYCMSKAAVSSLAEVLSYELKESGVSVTLISPGFVDTEIMHIDNYGRFQPDDQLAGTDANPTSLVARLRKKMRLSPAAAAREIVRATERREHERVLTAHGKLVIWFHKFAPFVLNPIRKTMLRVGRR